MSAANRNARAAENTNLVHLLELERNGREPSHELVQPLFPQLIVVLFLSVSLFRRVLSVLCPSIPLFLPLPVLLEDPKIGLGLLQLF
jgi:hypothetical protein